MKLTELLKQEKEVNKSIDTDLVNQIVRVLIFDNFDKDTYVEIEPPFYSENPEVVTWVYMVDGGSTRHAFSLPAYIVEEVNIHEIVKQVDEFFKGEKTECKESKPCSHPPTEQRMLNDTFGFINTQCKVCGYTRPLGVK